MRGFSFSKVIGFLSFSILFATHPAFAEVVGDSFANKDQQGCCCGTGKKTLLITIGGGMSGKSGPDSMFGKIVKETLENNPALGACIENKAIDYKVNASDYYWPARSLLVQQMVDAAQSEIKKELEGEDYCSVQVVGYSGGGYLASLLAGLNPNFQVHTINGSVTPVAEVPEEAASAVLDHIRDVALSEVVNTDLMEMFLDPKPGPVSRLPAPSGSTGFPITHYVADNDWVTPPVCQQSHTANSVVRHHNGGHMDNIPEILIRILSELPCEGCGDAILDKLAGEECDPPNAIKRMRVEPNQVSFFSCTNSCKIKHEILPLSVIDDPGLWRLRESGWVTPLVEAPWYPQSTLAPSLQQSQPQAASTGGGHGGGSSIGMSGGSAAFGGGY
jgi:hypothetical protein